MTTEATTIAQELLHKVGGRTYSTAKPQEPILVMMTLDQLVQLCDEAYVKQADLMIQTGWQRPMP